MTAPDPLPRCAWVRNPLAARYHDEEWGTPQHDDHALFELLTLEGAQAGLSWGTILRKREAYRRAFDGFDPRIVAAYGDRDVARLVADAGIVRNRLKIAAAIDNARAFLRVQEMFGSFDTYLWRFVDGRPIVIPRPDRAAVPARTERSDALARALKRRGFRFVGSTICYAFMQAAGLVDDHTRDCFRAVDRATDAR